MSEAAIAPKREWPRRVLGVLATIEPYLLLPLVILPLFVPNPWRPVEAAVALAFLIPRRLALGYAIRRTPLDLPIVLIVLGAAVGAVVSPLPEVSIERLWGYAGALLLFYLIATQRNEANLRAYLALLLVASLVAMFLVATWVMRASVASPLAALDRGQWLAVAGGRLFSVISETWPSPNAAACLLATTLPFALGGGLRARGLPRVALMLMAALIAVFALMAGNEGGRLAVAAGMLGVLAAMKQWRWLAVSILGLPLAVLALGWLGPPSAQWLRISEPSALFRLQIWQDSFSLIRLFPFTGVGLGAFPAKIEASFIGNPFMSTPLNAFLQTYLDLGPLGLIGLLWFLCSGLRASFAPAAAAETWARSCIKMGLAGAWLAFAVSGSFEATSAIVWYSGGTYHGIVSPLPWLLGALGAVLLEGRGSGVGKRETGDRSREAGVRGQETGSRLLTADS